MRMSILKRRPREKEGARRCGSCFGIGIFRFGMVSCIFWVFPFAASPPPLSLFFFLGGGEEEKKKKKGGGEGIRESVKNNCPPS